MSALAERSLTRAEKVSLIQQVRREHPELVDREKAALIGMTLSAFRNLVNDPDGAKQRARRDGYSGICEVCGGETKSDGTARASARCGPCSKEEKVWTAAAVIDAIQRWASEHGRPPTADDWLHADPVGGYPNRGNVYQSESRSSSPFESWADAIEAAGFPRPVRGYWQDESRRRGRYIEDARYGLGPLQIALLADLEDGQTRRFTWLSYGRTNECVSAALRALIERGLVVRVARGRYAATETDQQAAA